MSFTIRSALKYDCTSIALLHQTRIERGFLSSFGKRFLSALYGAMAEEKSAIVLVACNQKNDIIGFVAGTESIGTVYTSIIKKKWLGLLWFALPKLISFKIVKKCLETLSYPSQQKELSKKFTGAELLSIATHPGSGRHGVGSALVNELEKLLSINKSGEILRVATDANDVQSNGFYVKCGFTLAEAFEHHGIEMKHYHKTLLKY